MKMAAENWMNETDELVFSRFAGPAAVFSCVPDVSSHSVENIRIVRVNPAYVREIGMNFNPEEPEEQDPMEYFDPNSREVLKTNILRAAASAGETEEEAETWRHVTSRCCGEDRVCIRSAIRFLRTENGVSLFYARIRNVTKEKAEFRAVSESERKFRFASEQINVYAWEYTVATKEMRPCFRCMRDLGLPALVENYPEPVIESGLFPPDYADMYRDWHRQIAAGAEHLEAIIPLTVGRVPFHVRYTTEFDADGKPVKAYGSAALVVDGEDDLTHTEVMKALSSNYLSVFVADPEMKTVRVFKEDGLDREAAEQKKEFPCAEFMERFIADHVSAGDAGTMREALSAEKILPVLAAQKTCEGHYHEDNGRGLHHMRYKCMQAEGKKPIILAFRNADAEAAEEAAKREALKKARDEAEAANNAKTSFLFNMSHDIRTPMNAIIGFRDLLEKHQEDPAKRADYLGKIERSSRILLSIINNVLEMARIEKGTLEIEETPYSAEAFTDNLYSVFSEMMKQKNMTFTRQVTVQHGFVYGDPIKLREVFINILSNAYKYTEAGGSVQLKLEEIPSGRDGWALYRTTVTDTGIGMSEEFLPHLFEEFSRENSSTDNKIEGTGLGMPIVKRLVELMNGTIEVHSRKGEGSAFIVTIPHRIAERIDLTELPAAEVDPEQFRGKRILLAEDNDLNAEIAMEILSEVGFAVDRAEDGRIACEKLTEAADDYYDLILMDIQMPHMNGYEATRAIRRMPDSVKAGVPILAMTANAFEEDKREALRAGMNGHLAKPVNIHELLQALADILRTGRNVPAEE